MNTVVVFVVAVVVAVAVVGKPLPVIYQNSFLQLIF
jgi:hypothetical protein